MASQTVDDDNDPCWEQQFFFTDVHPASTSLRLTVYDEDLNQDERLGEAVVDLGTLNLTQHTELPLQINLDTQGSLSVVLTLEAAVQPAPAPAPLHTPHEADDGIAEDLSESSADSYSDAIADDATALASPSDSPVPIADAHEPRVETGSHVAHAELAPALITEPANPVTHIQLERSWEQVVPSAPVPEPVHAPIVDHPPPPVQFPAQDAVTVALPFTPAVASPTTIPATSKPAAMHSLDPTSATIAQLKVQLQASRIDQDRYAQSCWTPVRNWAALLKVPISQMSSLNSSKEALAPTLGELSELILTLDPAMTQRLSLVEQLLTLNHRLVRGDGWPVPGCVVLSEATTCGRHSGKKKTKEACISSSNSHNTWLEGWLCVLD
jgi:hypothetical protein